MIGKQNFTLLYDRARREAMTSRNITLGWSKTGLRPFNPVRVLKEIQKLETVKYNPLSIEVDKDSFLQVSQLETPKTFESLASLRKSIEINITQHKELDARTKLSIQKVVNTAKNAFADRAILLDENLLLFEQNNKKNTRTSIKACFRYCQSPKL